MKSETGTGRRAGTDGGAQGLAHRLRESREYLGLSQEVAADHLNIPRASISTIEAGKRKVSSSELQSFAKLYRTSVEYLLGEQPQDPVVSALFRAANSLTRKDREQVLRFAEFLRAAGAAPGAKR